MGDDFAIINIPCKEMLKIVAKFYLKPDDEAIKNVDLQTTDSFPCYFREDADGLCFGDNLLWIPSDTKQIDFFDWAMFYIEKEVLIRLVIDLNRRLAKARRGINELLTKNF